MAEKYISKITLPDGETYTLKASGGGGGSSVNYTPTITEGTELGTLTIDGENKTVYAPDISTKQDKLTTQTAYTSKGSATKVPQITTNTLGQVTEITEVDVVASDADTVDGKHASDFVSVTNPSSSGIYTHEGKIYVTRDGVTKAALWTDVEGGNLQLTSPNNTVSVQMDIFNDKTFRMFSLYNNTVYNIFSFDATTNEPIICGTDLYHLRTLNANGGFHGKNHTMYAQHNVDNDNRFKLRMTGGHEVRVDYATTASTANTAGVGNVLLNQAANSVRDFNNGTRSYSYEGGNITTHSLPYPHVEVLSMNKATDRGAEIAIKWNNSDPHAYIRGNHSAWSAWKELMRVGDTADTVDGYHFNSGTSATPSGAAGTIYFQYS